MNRTIEVDEADRFNRELAAFISEAGSQIGKIVLTSEPPEWRLI